MPLFLVELLPLTDTCDLLPFAATTSPRCDVVSIRKGAHTNAHARESVFVNGGFDLKSKLGGELHFNFQEVMGRSQRVYST